MNKKLILLLVCLNLCLFIPYNISALETSNFLSKMWLNGNGYYYNKRPDFIQNKFNALFGNTGGSFRLMGESDTTNNACYFNYNNGSPYIHGETSENAVCNSLKYTHFIWAYKANSFSEFNISVNDDNRDNIINQLKYLNWKYYETSDTNIKYFSPSLVEGFCDFGADDSKFYLLKETSNNSTYYYLRSRLSSDKTSIYAYLVQYQLDSSGDVTVNVSKTTYNYQYDYYKFWIDDYGRVYSDIGIYKSGGLIGISKGNPSTGVKPLITQNTTYLNNTDKLLNVAVLIGIIPTDNWMESEAFKYIATARYGSDYLTSLNFYSNGKTNMGVKLPYLNYGLDVTEKFLNNEQVPLPIIYSELIYNTKTYFNNKNNSYWITLGQIDSGGGSGEGGSGGSGDGGSGGSGDGGSGGSGDGSGGSGGDTTITIDTENIENLLQQILEAIQNQGTTDIDLTEIENLLNGIKNNLKDYTGDLSTINNTLTLINQFLNNNIDVPISDLKALLNDIKTLSDYQKEQLTGISGVLTEMKQLFINIFDRLGEIKDKIGSTINNIEEGTNLWDVLKALIDNLGEFLSSGLELFEKLLVPQGTFETDFNSTITGIQEKLGVLYQPVDVFSNFLSNLYAPSETSTLADSGHIIKIPEANYDGVTIIEAQSIDLDETVESSGLKPLYDVYLLIVDMIVLFGILNLAFKKFHDIISENGGDYK